MKSLLEEFLQGSSLKAHHYFGVHRLRRNGKYIHRFRLYAPNAVSVSLIGDFNDWKGNKHSLKKINEAGIWEIHIANLNSYDNYKYLIETSSGNLLEKADPYAFFSELRPSSASLIPSEKDYHWQDEEWMKGRTKCYDEPLNIYEVHLGSWRRDWKSGKWLTSKELAEQLVPYVKDNGYTHVEFLPLFEHPFDASWGYQATGYFSPTSRYGTPEELKALVDTFHRAGIGVILDVVPAHFVKDAHGLANFDGTHLYEYEKQYDSENEWGTLNFDLWNDKVRSFLMSSFAYWIEEYHLDGLRFDAISHIIYWNGDKNRGVNKGALDFIKRCNYHLSKKFPKVMLIAEDSSDFQGVTKPTFDGGLGFDYKWDLGWMNDTLKYFKLDPIYRPYNHQLITFSMLYFYSERFLLPLSHDEVVHMKGSIINKLWGTYEEKFATLRVLMGYMFAHPGKKLNFMGNELASFDEWSEEGAADFHLLKYPIHSAYLRYFRDLNYIYKSHPALYKSEYDAGSFRWIDADNNKQSVYSFYRSFGDETIVTVFNMQPVSYESFKIGVPKGNFYKELINSEKDIYNGNNMCNFKPIKAKKEERHGMEYTLDIRLSAYSCVYFINIKGKVSTIDKKALENKRTDINKKRAKK